MSEINKLTVNGRAYDLADADAREQLHGLTRDVMGVVCSQNCLPMNYYDGDDKKHYGITYEKQADGTVIANGTATNASRYYIAKGVPIKAGTYTLSGFPDGDSTKRFMYYRIGDGDGNWIYFREGSRTFTVETDSTLYVRIEYALGSATAENQQWCVMLEKGDTAHDFVSPNTTLGQMQKEISEHDDIIAGHIKAFDPIADAVSNLTRHIVDLRTMVEENTNMYINATTGELVPIVSELGVSNPYICKPGDALKYTLSCDTGLPILVTYDKNMKVVSSVIGQGQRNYITGEHIFTADERFFRICTVIPYLYAHSLEYVGSAADNNIPNYWKGHISQKIDTICEKDCLIGSHGDSFVFITDTHMPRNSLQSPALIKEIIGNTSVRFVINGGDTLNDHPTQGEALALFRRWRKMMHGVEEYRVMGNHDLNGSGQDVAEAVLSVDHWYGTMTKPFEHLVKTDGKPYFCIDNQSQKIRYICLSYHIGEAEEQAWLKARLTELETGWTVLVIPHYLFNDSAGTIHEGGQKVINCINEVYGTMQATLIGVLAGHNHADYSTTESVNGYHLIATTCDARDGTPAKTYGTETEQAFDVIHIDTAARKMYATRIGAGTDREWSY